MSSSEPIDRNNIININIGILGHVDSGKTSLVKALSTSLSTAALDKNPQSQQRGITLDLGFSAFTVPLPSHLEEQLQNSSFDSVQITLVDCPGHASLIRTIIGGAQIIDMMVLVVDANKGIQTQTAECIVIGEITTENLIIVLNKIDMIPEDERTLRLQKMTKRINRVFSTTKFRNPPIVYCAAAVGGEKVASVGAAFATASKSSSSSSSSLSPITEGVDSLVSLIQSSLSLPRRDTSSPFYFSIDHCFQIKGHGTVLTGTVLSGSVSINSVVELPLLQTTRKVKSMQMFRKPVKSAKQGDRVALCVTNLDPSLIERGMAAAPDSVPLLSTVVCMVRRIRFFQGPCKTHGKFHVTIGHNTVVASAIFFGAEELAAHLGHKINPETGTIEGGETLIQTADFQTTGTPSTSRQSALNTSFLRSFPSLPFDPSQEFEFQSDLVGPSPSSCPGAAFGSEPPQWALLQFQQPVYAPLGSLIIGSRLDVDNSSSSTSSSSADHQACRLAFFGPVKASLPPISEWTGKGTGTGRDDANEVRIFTWKEKACEVLKITDSKSGSANSTSQSSDQEDLVLECVAHNLVSEKGSIQPFLGLRVKTPRGDVGVITAPFGSGAKFKVKFPLDLLGNPSRREGGALGLKAGDTLTLRFKRFIHDKLKSMQQTGEDWGLSLPPPPSLTTLLDTQPPSSLPLGKKEKTKEPEKEKEKEKEKESARKTEKGLHKQKVKEKEKSKLVTEDIKKILTREKKGEKEGGKGGGGGESELKANEIEEKVNDEKQHPKSSRVISLPSSLPLPPTIPSPTKLTRFTSPSLLPSSVHATHPPRSASVTTSSVSKPIPSTSLPSPPSSSLRPSRRSQSVGPDRITRPPLPLPVPVPVPLPLNSSSSGSTLGGGGTMAWGPGKSGRDVLLGTTKTPPSPPLPPSPSSSHHPPPLPPSPLLSLPVPPVPPNNPEQEKLLQWREEWERESGKERDRERDERRRTGSVQAAGPGQGYWEGSFPSFPPSPSLYSSFPTPYHSSFAPQPTLRGAETLPRERGGSWSSRFPPPHLSTAPPFTPSSTLPSHYFSPLQSEEIDQNQGQGQGQGWMGMGMGMGRNYRIEKDWSWEEEREREREGSRSHRWGGSERSQREKGERDIWDWRERKGKREGGGSKNKLSPSLPPHSTDLSSLFNQLSSLLSPSSPTALSSSSSSSSSLISSPSSHSPQIISDGKRIYFSLPLPLPSTPSQTPLTPNSSSSTLLLPLPISLPAHTLLQHPSLTTSSSLPPSTPAPLPLPSSSEPSPSPSPSTLLPIRVCNEGGKRVGSVESVKPPSASDLALIDRLRDLSPSLPLLPKGEELEGVVAIISGAFRMEENVREWVGRRARTGDSEWDGEGFLLAPFAKMGKCKVFFPLYQLPSIQILIDRLPNGSLVELDLNN